MYEKYLWVLSSHIYSINTGKLPREKRPKRFLMPKAGPTRNLLHRRTAADIAAIEGSYIQAGAGRYFKLRDVGEVHQVLTESHSSHRLTYSTT